MIAKFVKVNLDTAKNSFENISLFPDIVELLKEYHDRLFDDYSGFSEESASQKTLELINRTAPCFWAVLERNTGEFAGIVFLDGWVGSKTSVHSASVTTCFRKKFWGKFTKQVAKLFARYVFKKYRLKKLRAQVFAFNNNVCGLLRRAGFVHEATLRAETIVREELTDLKVFGLFPNQI